MVKDKKYTAKHLRDMAKWELILYIEELYREIEQSKIFVDKIEYLIEKFEAGEIGYIDD